MATPANKKGAYPLSNNVERTDIKQVVVIDLNNGRQVFLAPGSLQQIIEQDDLNIAITYYDQGTVDERINTVVWSSLLLADSVTATMSYTGTAGSYSISGLQFS